jgi:D-amino-acid dehydrogenase
MGKVMGGSPHIIIIGAGLIGLSSADALVRRGAKVTLFEARPAPLQGASFANSGMIHPSQACPWAGPANDPGVDAAVLDLAHDSRDRLTARMAALGLTDMLDRPAGCYQVFSTADAAQAAAERFAARGICVESVAASEWPLAFPALFFPDDRSADAFAYGSALSQYLRSQGVRVHYDCAPTLQGGSGQACRLIHDGQVIESDGIILACGAQTDDILAPLGLSLGIQPVRGWAIDFDLPERMPLPPSPIMDAETRSAVTLFKDRLRLSGTWGEATADLLRSRWRLLLPDLETASLTERLVWSGLRPVSSLGRPFIGQTTIKGLWVNAGHGHMGWTLSAGSGELIARLIFSESADARFAVPPSPGTEAKPTLAMRP